MQSCKAFTHLAATFCTAATLLLSTPATAQTVSTVAGTGVASSTGDGGVATAATIQGVWSILARRDGSVLIAELNGHRVRKVDTTGIITTFAGTGTSGFTASAAAATSANLNGPGGLAEDALGNVYIGSQGAIQKVSPSGVLSTVAGNGTLSNTGDGGLASAATVNFPVSMAFDASGNLFFSDYSAFTVRKIDNTSTPMISNIAGVANTAGNSADGVAAATATLNRPLGLVIQRDGSILVADGVGGGRVRKIIPGGAISTIAGLPGVSTSTGDNGPATAATLNTSYGLAQDNLGNIYVGEIGSSRVRKIAINGIITTLIGTPAGAVNSRSPATDVDGAIATATVYGPIALSFDALGDLYVASFYGSKIRKVTFPATNVVQVATGNGYSCALESAGTVKCWGDNTFGQLGLNNRIASGTPQTVLGLTGISQIAVGSGHACAIQSGAVLCWGNGASGQLGVGNTTTFTTPQIVSGLSGVSQLTAGANHTCAALQDGTMRCWGLNSSGQLGIGTNSNATTPQPVVGVSGVNLLAAGGSHTCARQTGNTLKCWGLNSSGQLGLGNTTNFNTPQTVPSVTGVAHLANGLSHTCVRLIDGTVQCWGSGTNGQLGAGNLTGSTTPQTVPGLSGIAQMAVGGTHTCARESLGTLKCWGDNRNGQLGIGSSQPSFSTPQTVLGLRDLTQVVAGNNHTCALLENGSLKCWGGDASGQLGLRTDITADTKTPQVVPGSNGVSQQVVTGDSHNCVRETNGVVKCWGANSFGQLGVGNNVNASTPQLVLGLTAVTQLASSVYHTCAIETAGTVKCWGSNDNAQLGLGNTTSFNTPQAIASLNNIIQIATGYSHSCALDTAGTVKCWGRNAEGQLGIGSNVSATTPQTITTLSGVTQIATGDFYACAVLAAGSVACWGANVSGQLGTGNTTNANTPQIVPGLSDVVAVTLGGEHSCARLSTGAVKCWGGNTNSQLGLGTSVNTLNPTTVNGLTAITQIAAGYRHTCAAASNGTVQCWGANGAGNLGLGTITNANTPQLVTLLNGAGATSIAAGGGHTCALVTGNALQCWGNNGNGQLGLGNILLRTTPQPVSGFGLNLAAQTITFSTVTAGVAGAASLMLTATWGASGNAVTFTSTTPTVCSTTGSNGATLSFLTTGNCSIEANQAGNSTYLAALTVPRSIIVTVVLSAQTITFNLPATGVIGATTLTLSATGGASGNAVIFASTTPTVCSTTGTNGAMLSFLAAGTCTVNANQAGSVAFSAASTVTQSITVGAAQSAQTITFTLPATSFIGATPLTLTATGGASGNAVTFASATPAICTTTGANGVVLSFLAGGACTIIANQAGSVAFSPAAAVTRSISVSTAQLANRYRLYVRSGRGHLYTTDLNEYEVLPRIAPENFVPEGIAHKVFKQPITLNGQAAVPYYRLFIKTIGQHFWTTDANEYNVLRAQTAFFADDGIDSYIFLQPGVSGTIPLYRLVLANTPLHVWTTDQNEFNVLSTRGWIPEGSPGNESGVTGYVFPP